MPSGNSSNLSLRLMSANFFSVRGITFFV
jgi:hypothetical protein